MKLDSLWSIDPIVYVNEMESAEMRLESGEREPDYYRQDQVLKSDRFFLIGRGGFGNFHS